MQLITRIRRALRPIRQRWEPSFLKGRRMDKEYASGRWVHFDDTSGAWVYQFIHRYCRQGSILDLGCGAGNTGNELDGTSYHDYTGIDISTVAVRRATERSVQNGRAGKNQYLSSDIVSYMPSKKHDLILFRESFHMVPRARMKETLDRYAGFLRNDGVFIVYLSRDSTDEVREIIGWIEANYHVVEKQWREAPAPDAAAFHGDAFLMVFRPLV
jgi:SAM-dependent methyltransferase